MIRRRWRQRLLAASEPDRRPLFSLFGHFVGSIRHYSKDSAHAAARGIRKRWQLVVPLAELPADCAGPGHGFGLARKPVAALHAVARLDAALLWRVLSGADRANSDRRI